MAENQNNPQTNAPAAQAPVIREGQPTRHETVPLAPEQTFSEQGQSIAQQVQQKPAPEKPAPAAAQEVESGSSSPEAQSQQEAQPPKQSAVQHQQPSQAQHAHQMPSESDLARSQLRLLAAANRTLLDILLAQHSNGEEMCVNEATLDIFMRNQVIYEAIIDGFQE